MLIGLGAVAGLLLAGWRAPQKDRIRYVDAGALTLVGALLGSRAVSVAANWSYYQSHTSEIYRVWMGGLSGIGALVGGVVVVTLIGALWKIPVGNLADVLLPLAGTLTVTAWMGCWIDGCSYGNLSATWFAVPARDEWGVVANRIPVQLIGAVSTLILIWLIDWSGKRLAINGMSASLGLLGLSSVVFMLSYLRADPTLIWKGFRLEAWGAVGLMIFSSLTVVVLLFFRKNKG